MTMPSTTRFWATFVSILVTWWWSSKVVTLLLPVVSAQEEESSPGYLRSRQLFNEGDGENTAADDDEHSHHWRHHRKLQRAIDRELAVPNQYIVTFSKDVPPQVVQEKREALLKDCWKDEGDEGYDEKGEGDYCQVLQNYEWDMNGFAARLSTAALVHLLQDDDVQAIEEDQIVESYAAERQRGAVWNLDRLDGSQDSAYEYSTTGRGVVAYVVDSGLNTQHSEFAGGRATCGMDLVNPRANCKDEQGHGSHVAGIAAGSTYGVAKDLEIVGMRVLDARGRGTVSNVVRAIDEIIADKNARPNVPMIANLSLGGNPSMALDSAVKEAVQAGIIFVIAAGNEDVNACDKSPSRVSQAITVGASNKQNKVAYFSNFGRCVDIFGPGEEIMAAWGQGGFRKISGTSMASPHIVGVAALYLEDHPDWSPNRLWNEIKKGARSGALSSLKDSSTPNRLISTGKLMGRRNADLCENTVFLGPCTQTDECCEACFGICWKLREAETTNDEDEPNDP